VKRQRRDADYILPSTVELKNDGVIPPIPPHPFMARCLLDNIKETINLPSRRKQYQEGEEISTEAQ
jgi:hypothetical protein